MKTSLKWGASRHFPLISDTPFIHSSVQLPTADVISTFSSSVPLTVPLRLESSLTAVDRIKKLIQQTINILMINDDTERNKLKRRRKLVGRLENSWNANLVLQSYSRFLCTRFCKQFWNKFSYSAFFFFPQMACTQWDKLSPNEFQQLQDLASCKPTKRI